MVEAARDRRPRPPATTTARARSLPRFRIANRRARRASAWRRIRLGARAARGRRAVRSWRAMFAPAPVSTRRAAGRTGRFACRPAGACATATPNTSEPKQPAHRGCILLARAVLPQQARSPADHLLRLSARVWKEKIMTDPYRQAARVCEVCRASTDGRKLVDVYELALCPRCRSRGTDEALDRVGVTKRTRFAPARPL